MAKEEYEYIKAIVDCGSLRWAYRVKGASVEGQQSCDDDVSEWSDRDIKDVTMSMLDVPAHQRELIEIEYH